MCSLPIRPLWNVRARLDHRAACQRHQASAVCRRRAALRVIHTPVSSRALGLTQGSCERRYNIRLHKTAPRERRTCRPRSTAIVASTNQRSGLLIVGYTSGTGVPRTSVSGAVDRGLSGRAAPLVNRTVGRTNEPIHEDRIGTMSHLPYRHGRDRRRRISNKSCQFAGDGARSRRLFRIGSSPPLLKCLHANRIWKGRWWTGRTGRRAA